MAWRCSAATNEGLIANLIDAGLVKTEAVAAAMRRVDRAWFMPPGLRAHTRAYEDAPQPIGHQVTISAPHMHAIMLEILAPYVRAAAPAAASGDRSGSNRLRVLDVGSGSGYLTAVLADLCAAATPHWQVVGLEHVEALQQRSAAVLAEHFPEWMSAGRVTIVCDDGRNPSAAALAPLTDEEPGFDLIHVGAAAETIPPPLEALLRRGGCMVIPVGAQHQTQQLLICRRATDGTVSVSKDCLVSFVPLTSLDHQQRGR